MSLTEAAIRAAKPGDVLKDVAPGVPGLQLRAFPQSKGFYLYYRNQAGTQRKPKLGDWGQLTLTTAREVARKWLARVAAGEDPAAARQEARDEPTLDELWETYKERHLERQKDSTQGQYKRRYARRLKIRWGSRKLSGISHEEVDSLVQTIGKTHKTEANEVLKLLTGLYSFAAGRPLQWKGENPCKGVERFPDVKRRRYMKGEEPMKIAAVLDREAATHPQHVAFVYLLILSGARKGEIGNARREWIEGNVLHLPDSKTGAKDVFLPPQALEVIARIPPQKNGTICGIKQPDEFWQRVRREAGCPDLRLHDLRHSFASAAIGAGYTLAQIGELLGHKRPQTTMRYAHLMEDAALAASTATADRIMATMKKTPSDPAPIGGLAPAK